MGDEVRWMVEGWVKGKAFHELTLVAGPNVSDGFLSSSTFCPLGASTSSLGYGFQLDPARRVMGPRRTEQKRAVCCTTVRVLGSWNR